jgi:hypothetical protein
VRLCDWARDDVRCLKFGRDGYPLSFLCEMGPSVNFTVNITAGNSTAHLRTLRSSLTFFVAKVMAEKLLREAGDTEAALRVWE